MDHEKYMRRAIQLAKKGVGWTAPNPMVGAVIVKDGRIIGEGYHQRCGELHAERNAFASLSESAQGATLYVTLEPCCHYGRTPPCTEAILENGIKTVYIGSRDPNPRVSGKGAAILREHGIEVIEDFLRDECDKLNPVFFHYITKHKPYVVMKYAMTLDGKIATVSGESQWITGEEARQHVQKLRGHYASILAGIGTALADDPMLNCRIDGAHQPLRIILDSKLKISLDSKLVTTAKEYPLLIVCAEENENAAALRSSGAEVIQLADKNGQIDLPALLNLLADRGIDSILVEGGGIVHGSFVSLGLVDHVCAYIGNKIFGGDTAKSPVEGRGIASIASSLKLTNPTITPLGDDILLEYEVKENA